MADLSRRSTRPEEMDAETTDPATYARCLADLAQLNRVTFTHQPVLAWLDTATRTLPPDAAISILDVACGHGDLLRAIHRWAVRRRRAVRLSGIDLNPRSAAIAAQATPPGMDIVWRTGDVFAYAPDPPADLIVTSQFTHHLTDPELVRFLVWLSTHARRGWFIADLHRHAIAYYGFPLLARVAGWHRIVRQDGQISIARGFRRAEWEQRLAEAGVTAEISRHFAFRYGVSHLS
jgi:2-polyprenyl-3-methyl-5-hydroxy-6-metoxy-1,4-benzoquinol methylase